MDMHPSFSTFSLFILFLTIQTLPFRIFIAFYPLLNIVVVYNMLANFYGI